MLRLLGFLIGSAVALSLILVVSGRIEPSELDDAAQQVQRVAQNAVDLADDIKTDLVAQQASDSEPLKQTDLQPLPEPEPEQVVEATSLIEAPVDPQPALPEPFTEPEPVAEPVADPEPITEPITEPDPIRPGPQEDMGTNVQTVERGLDESLFDHRVSPLVKDPDTEVPLDEQMQADGLLWHVFWDPFRSELAATGFIEQLESVTPLNYGVIRRKIGVYEVAFAYSNEDERDAGLQAIELATGISFAEWQE